LAFYHFSICVVVSFSIWSGSWQLTVVGLLLVVFRIFPLLFSLLTGNIHHCPFCFLLFNFSHHSNNFLFRFFFIYRSFYSFQYSPSIAISHILVFHFNPYFLKFLIFSLTLLLKFFFLSISSFNQVLCCFIFF